MFITNMLVIMIAGALVAASAMVVYVKYEEDQNIRVFISKLNEAFNVTIDLLNNETYRADRLADQNTNLTLLIDNLNTSMNQSNNRIENISYLLFQKNETISSLQEIIANYQIGSALSLHIPSYEEMISFLENDTVDSNNYTDWYKCRHYARDLKNNATEKGIRSAYVEIYGPLTGNENDTNQSHWRGHCLNMFLVTNGSNYYIEPQTDGFVDLRFNTTIAGIYVKDIIIIW